MFANPSKFAHVVVTGFNYRVNMADKAEILVKYEANILHWFLPRSAVETTEEHSSSHLLQYLHLFYENMII